MIAEKPSALDCLLPLMKEKGVSLPPDEFHHRVNLAFHAVESRLYDVIHENMWQSLPQQFELLSTDVASETLPDRMAALDIGCGTGLSSELLLRTSLGKRVGSIDLLDTSKEMLERCRARAERWGVRHRLVEGMIDALPPVGEAQYDLIVTCSVLHHIVEIEPFLAQVRERLRVGGLFIHLQDPNGDYLQAPEVKARVARLEDARRPRLPVWVRRLSPARIAGRIWREVTRTQRLPARDYAHDVSDALLKAGVIQRPMSSLEIWSVTDLHVEGLPYSLGDGVSLRTLVDAMDDCKLLTSRSYAFFGPMVSELPKQLQKVERELIERRDPSGTELAAVWRKVK